MRTSVLLTLLAIAIFGCKDRGTDGRIQGSEESTSVVRLHQAAQKGDLSLFQSLISAGCKVDACDKNGYTPLDTAATYGQAAIVEFLISKGTDVNVRTLYGGTALHRAAGNGHTEIVELLIGAGADVNAGRDRGRTPLYGAGSHLLADQAHEDIVRLLLAHGAEIIPGNTRENGYLLYFAVARGMHDLIAKLLAAGADPNTVSRGATGKSVLGEAVALGDPEAARLLIAGGADVNKRDELGWVPLQHARHWSTDVVEMLLAKGADVKTGLLVHWFVNADEPKVLELLLAHGADVNQMDEAGETPLDLILSVNPGHTRMIELLKKYGGTRGRSDDAQQQINSPSSMHSCRYAKTACKCLAVSLGQFSSSSLSVQP